MRAAIYNGNIVNALDSKNRYGIYINQVHNEYKMAGQNGLLICPGCRSKVTFRAGNVYEPYFAHIDTKRECEYDRDKNKTEEQKKGEIILYYWLNEQYKGHVFLDKKYNNRFSNVSLEYKGNIYAFNYIRNERVLNEWDKKRKDYLESGIVDLYFFSYKEFDAIKNSEIQFKRTVQQYAKDETIKMINTDSEELILMRFMEVYVGNELFDSELSIRKYYIYNVEFTEDGQLVTNFEEEFNKDYEQFKKNAEDKLKEQIKKENEEKEIQKQQQIFIEFHNTLISNQQSLTDVKLQQVSDLFEIPDIFVDINREKYINPEGLTPNELDEKVKKYISNRTTEDFVWKLGKTNPIRLLQCRYCRNYFSEEHCKPVKPHFGICDSCRIIYRK